MNDVDYYLPRYNNILGVQTPNVYVNIFQIIVCKICVYAVHQGFTKNIYL